MTPRQRWWLQGAGIAYASGLVILLLWPRGMSVRRLNLEVYRFFLGLGAPEALRPAHYAFLTNALVFVPPVLVAGLLSRRTSVWWWAWAGMLTSVAIELVQRLTLPTRVPSWTDVLANSLGALAGAGLAALLRRGLPPDPAAVTDATEVPGRR